MKINLSKEEVEFLIESLKWSKLGYEERAQKYLNNPNLDYRKNIFNPNIEKFNKITNKLREAK